MFNLNFNKMPDPVVNPPIKGTEVDVTVDDSAPQES